MTRMKFWSLNCSILMPFQGVQRIFIIPLFQWTHSMQTYHIMLNYFSAMYLSTFFNEVFIELSFNSTNFSKFYNSSIFFLAYNVLAYWAIWKWKDSREYFLIYYSFLYSATLRLCNITNRYLYFGVNSFMALSW